MTLDELGRTWEGKSEARVAREDAFWAYWTQTARASGGLQSHQWAELSSCDIGGVGNVIGELAQRDSIPRELVASVRSRLGKLESADARWAEVQVDAREAVRALVSGAPPDEHLLDEVARTTSSSTRAASRSCAGAGGVEVRRPDGVLVPCVPRPEPSASAGALRLITGARLVSAGTSIDDETLLPRWNGRPPDVSACVAAGLPRDRAETSRRFASRELPETGTSP